MIDKLQQAFKEATATFREQASQLGNNAKEKTYQLIEDWLKVFPKLEIYGLEINSFAFNLAFNPSLEVEMLGLHEKFTMDRIDQILSENKKDPAILSVMNTIKMTYNLHKRTYGDRKEPLIVKIKVKVTPEIKVFIGKPLIE
ncbi:MAG: hypothetical protein AAFO07_11170 [Bacteroidota bacterium]